MTKEEAEVSYRALVQLLYTLGRDAEVDIPPPDHVLISDENTKQMRESITQMMSQLVNIMDNRRPYSKAVLRISLECL